MKKQTTTHLTINIGGNYLVNFLIICMIAICICKLTESGDKDVYRGVSKDKINKIREILKEK